MHHRPGHAKQGGSFLASAASFAVLLLGLGRAHTAHGYSKDMITGYCGTPMVRNLCLVCDWAV